MADRIEKTVSFELPEGYNFSEYNLDIGYYQCPNCEQFKATRHRGKKIGECLSCGENLQFSERSATFIKVEE